MDFLFIILSIAFLLTGIISGFIAGLLGVGGGIIIVPITYFILLNLGYSIDVVMHIAITSSLGIIVLTSISSIRSHMKLKNIDFDIVKKWAPGIIIGSIIGSFSATFISGEYLVLIFCTILFLLSIRMFFQKGFIFIANDIPKNFLLNFLISSMIGFLSVIMGIGGGSFSVPTLSAFSKSIHRAIGTSAFIGFLISAPGVITYILSSRDINGLPPYSFGYANYLIILLVASTSIFTANIGAKFSFNTKKSTLKKIFAVFLFCTCISLIIEHFIF